MMSIRVTQAVLFLFGVLLASPAIAGSIAEKIKNPEWSNEKTYKECGQSCLYQKGNEVISVDASYVLHKLEALRKAQPGEIRETLRGFCMDESVAEGGETAEECRDRYILFETARLAKMGKEIGTNENNAYRLNSDLKKGPVAVKSHNDTSKQRGQVGSFLTADEVEQAAKDLQDRGTLAFEDWQRENPLAPEEIDFTHYKEKEVKDGGGAGRKFLTEDQTADGKTKQAGKYKTAKDQTDAVMKDKTLSWKEVNDKERKTREGYLKGSKGKLQKVTDLEKKAYSEARKDVVSSINGLVAKKGAKPTGKLGRDVAGDAETILTPKSNDTEFFIRWDPDELDKAAFQELSNQAPAGTVADPDP